MKFHGAFILVTGKKPGGLGLLDIGVKVPYESTVRISTAQANVSKDLERAYNAHLLTIKEPTPQTGGRPPAFNAAIPQQAQSSGGGDMGSVIAAINDLKGTLLGLLREKTPKQLPPQDQTEILAAINRLTEAVQNQPTPAPGITKPADLQEMLGTLLANMPTGGGTGPARPTYSAGPTFIPKTIREEGAATGTIQPENLSIEGGRVSEAQAALKAMRAKTQDKDDT